MKRKEKLEIICKHLMDDGIVTNDQKSKLSSSILEALVDIDRSENPQTVQEFIIANAEFLAEYRKMIVSEMKEQLETIEDNTEELYH